MEISELPKNKQIILFDGVCNLCNSAIQFIIKNDENDVFRFVNLQSELGQKIVKHIGIDNQNIDSIILYKPRIAYYYKSEAVFQIAKKLKGILRLVSIFNIFPSTVSNFFYDCIAKNRYKWFGKQEFCLIHSEELNLKFLN